MLTRASGLLFTSIFAINQALAQSSASPEIVLVPVSELQPTQAFIAHDQVNYNLQRYRIDPQKMFDDLCENRGQGDDAVITADSRPADHGSFRCRLSDQPGARPQDMKTAVRGPGGQLYLTDGHHTFSIFQDSELIGPELEVAVVVTHDRSDLDNAAFQEWLQDSHLTWLFDAQGQPITADQIPSGFGREDLADDPYRAAMFFLRDLIWQRPQPAMPFAEFYWAAHIRSFPHLQVPELNSAAAYLRWLERISGHMLALSADTAIGPDGQGPDAMGRLSLDQVRDLGVLICNRGEPGRLALALSARGVHSACADVDQMSAQALVLSASGPVSAVAPAANELLAVIEIPAGSLQKWQMDKAHPGMLEWEAETDPVSGASRPRVIQYLPYPVNYGALPGTLAALEEGGDGDPLDVLVLGPALPQGTSLMVKVLAVLTMQDNGETDDKLLAVTLDDPLYRDIKSLADLNRNFPGITDIIALWFQNYKGDTGSVSGLQWQEWP